jgi:hypothetical protein
VGTDSSVDEASTKSEAPAKAKRGRKKADDKKDEE